MALAGVGLVLSGCQLTPSFDATYQMEADRLRASPVPGTLVVQRFEEQRPPRLWSTTGKLFLLYIPIIPWVTMPFERVDESVRQISEGIERSGRGITLGADVKPAPEFEAYTYPESFPRTIAQDLAAGGLFTESRYIGDQPAADARYVLSGSVRETPLRRSATSFGLGMPGVLLWFLPVPMAKTTASVEVDLSLVDQQTGEEIWKRTLSSEVSRMFMLYTSSAMVYGRSGAFSFNLEPPPSDAHVDRRSLFGWHFAALRRAMLDARQDLAATLSRRNAGGDESAQR
ncbi:MAG: hypothetical protein ACREI8_13840 [Myxococcota bacterium]